MAGRRHQRWHLDLGTRNDGSFLEIAATCMAKEACERFSLANFRRKCQSANCLLMSTRVDQSSQNTHPIGPRQWQESVLRIAARGLQNELSGNRDVSATPR